MPYSVEGWIPPAPARLKSFLKGHDIDSEVLDLNLEIFKNILDPTLAKQIADWCRKLSDNPQNTLLARKYMTHWANKCVKIFQQRQVKNLLLSLPSLESQIATEMLCAFVKKHLPEVNVVCGGPGTSTFENGSYTWANKMINKKYADHVVVGEGEKILSKIINDSAPKGLHVVKPLDVTEWTGFFPNYDDYELESYTRWHEATWGDTDQFLPITASKGCVRTCSFCDVQHIWPKFAFRSGEDVANEMIFQYEKYGVKRFSFTDSLINGSISNYRKMNEIIAKKYPNHFEYYAHFICRPKRQFPSEDFITMKQAGAHTISIGMESGSERVRNHMKKKFSDADIDYTVTNLAKNNINQVWMMIYGYPTETLIDHQASLDLYKRHRHLNNKKSIRVRGMPFQLIGNSPIGLSSNHKINPDFSDVNIISEVEDDNYGHFWLNLNNPNLNYEERIRRWLEAESLLSELGYNKNTQSTNMIKFKKLYQSTIDFYQCNKKQYEFAV